MKRHEVLYAYFKAKESASSASTSLQPLCLYYGNPQKVLIGKRLRSVERDLASALKNVRSLIKDYEETDNG